tara:strand:+ start:2425 stop:3363 length:939 start_codon:yes stop_codon:yes gene_type:complete
MKYSVDIDAGNDLVERLKVKAPSIGGFNGLFEIPSGYEKPVLVSGADGVGTKINICRIASDYTTIGIDLVAMCVNDVICSGAKPLYFLDYISTKKIDTNVDDILSGIVKGCEIAGMELLGGETAEHYRATEYDLAGFCAGIVEKNSIVDGSNIRPGDIVIGIESSGLHSNGYSLINDMIWVKDKPQYYQAMYEKLMPGLLTPTTIYSPLIQQLLDEVPILGMAHITGGGILENLPRCLPMGLTVDINYNAWERPEIFSKIQKAGNVEEEEMRRVFNLGIGFCIIVPPDVVDETKYFISEKGMNSWVIGEVYE